MVPATSTATALAAKSAAEVADAIREEALRPNGDPEGLPLPLAAHWNTGHYARAPGMHPDFEISLIEQGAYVMPSFHHPPYFHEQKGVGAVDLRYYERAIGRAARLRLPLTFVGSQWESALTLQDEFFRLPSEQNPNVISPNGQVLKKVSPFGPVEPWSEVGRRWTATTWMRMLQHWYPNPPLVMFLSNNEHAKLSWHEADQSKRFLTQYGKLTDENRIRQLFAQGWIERYRALQQGMRQGLVADAWKEHSIFVGYDAFGPAFFGRWSAWPRHALTTSGAVDPWPLAFDGGSPSFYVHSWNPSTDYTVWSPQLEANNWPFMLLEAWRLNPKFWWEISVWDGYDPKKADCMRKTYARLGQEYGPARYRGLVQFGMWLLRPRVVREFRGWTYSAAEIMPYFQEILDSVARVHENPTLRAFWRKGRLVSNKTRKHPYQSNIPDQYEKATRWFLLDTNLTPPRPWKLDTEIPVWAIALVLDAAPRRQWLIYAQSPLKERQGVVVSVPGYGNATVNATVGGAFYLVKEGSRTAERIAD